MRRIPIERAALPAALAVGALLASPPLLAEPGVDRAQARAHFDRGVALAKQHQYRDALAAFQLAYEAFPNYGALYNIAQAQILLDHPSAAIVTLERYLTDGGAQIEASRRREVEATLSRLRDKTATITLSVEPSGALVTLDGEPIGRAPIASPIRVDPGPHLLEATLESGAARELTLEIAARQALSAHLDLRTEPSAAAAAAPPGASATPAPAPTARPVAQPRPLQQPSPTPRPVRPTDHGTQRTLGYAIGAVGVALSGVALGHYLWNRGRYDDWQARSNDYYRDPTDQHRESANALARSIPAASVVTVGLAIGAGVGLGTGTVLVLTSGSGHSSAATSGGTLLGVRGEF